MSLPVDARHLVTWTVAALAVAGVVVRPFRWPEAVWACAGAAGLVAAGLLSPAAAWRGALKGLDVYRFLLGMMILSEVARGEGLFDWLAGVAVRQAKGSASRLFALVYGVGVVVTAFLSNDATAVVLTPAVYAAARAAKAEPLPYLFACALVANAASFALPISNPANLVVYADRVPTLGPWLGRFALPSLLSLAVTFAVLRLAERARLAAPIEAAVAARRLSRSGAVAGLGIAATAVTLLVSSALGFRLGPPTLNAGLATAAVVLAVERKGPAAIVEGIAWAVLPLVAGLFVLVEALEATGALATLADALRNLSARSDVLAGIVGGALVALGSNLVNNLPASLLAGAAVQGAHASDWVAGAVLVGVNLGPNLSVTGSLATILWLAAVRREGEDVSAWTFLKLGALAMPPALAGLLLH